MLQTLASDDDWAGFTSDPMADAIIRLLGLDPTRDRRTLLEFVTLFYEVADLKARLGPEAVAHILEPVPNMEKVRHEMAEYMQQERSWVTVEDVLGITWVHQAKSIMNGRTPNMLLLWTPEKRLEFELDVRDGMRPADLLRKYQDIGARTVRTLRHMMLGEI